MGKTRYGKRVMSDAADIPLQSAMRGTALSRFFVVTVRDRCYAIQREAEPVSQLVAGAHW